MDRRQFLAAAPAAFLGAQTFREVSAIPEPHFPGRLYQFVWRNWELARLDRMAKVVHATEAQLRDLGASMGLPAKPAITDDQSRRSYITVIRQNWHLLPEEQIIELLGWDQERYRFTLKEDDFLDHKLGHVKPACSSVRYAPPSAEEKARASEIRRLLQGWFGKELARPGEERFAFVSELAKRSSGLLRNPGRRAHESEIDLGDGWEIVSQDEAAAKELRSFLIERMGVKPGASKQVLLQISADGPPGYSIRCSADHVAISAPNSASLLQAVYEIERTVERREGPFLAKGEITRRELWSPRYMYSYFALYGDPLMEGDAAGLPDGYLQRAAANGMTGVWIQAVLNNLAPSKHFPEFGKGSATRLPNLRALTERADKFGLKIFLYLNEPRAMPASFFRDRPDIRGAKYQDLYSMCTSTEPVRDWIRSSLSHIFHEAPATGGVFSITMSENHTNCFSHGGAWGDKDPVASDCPRCSKRTGAETIGELIHTFRDGVREQSKSAEVISWDWGWGTPLADGLIPRLPHDSTVSSISEWSLPVNRGGVKNTVGEYSISVVGPGPRAARNWSTAKKRGLKTLAKTQFNNTWEISAVPYIPVLPLVLQHCEGLAAAKVNGVMASWTCGGYPSPNLRAAAAYAFEPRPARELVLKQEAELIYGSEGADSAIAAWKAFSEAFQEFPYGVHIYVIPTQHGPANLLRLQPTNLQPGMMLFPYDAYKTWSGAYPPEVVRSQLRKLVARWREGTGKLEQALQRTPPQKRAAAARELAIARTCQNHFGSTANQIEFYLLRDALADASPEQQKRSRQRMIEIAKDELELSRQQYFVARSDSTIGYEASNHYYYNPLDLVEKMLNCDRIIKDLQKRLA